MDAESQSGAQSNWDAAWSDTDREVTGAKMAPHQLQDGEKLECTHFYFFLARDSQGFCFDLICFTTDWLALLASKFSTEGKEKKSGGIKWEEFINNVQSPFKRRTEQNVDSNSTAPSRSIFYCFFLNNVLQTAHRNPLVQWSWSVCTKKTTPKKTKTTQRSNWTADRSSLLEVVTAGHRKCWKTLMTLRSAADSFILQIYTRSW